MPSVLTTPGEIVAYHAKMKKTLLNACKDGLERVNRKTESELKETAPVVTGNYRDSIRAKPASKRAFGWESEIFFGADYSTSVHQRHPHQPAIVEASSDEVAEAITQEVSEVAL